MPEDLYEAIRLAAKAERKSQNDLIVDILTAALSQVPDLPAPETDED
jgi:plasmid stability protein